METLEEFSRGLHQTHTDTDDIIRYWHEDKQELTEIRAKLEEAKTENAELKEAVSLLCEERDKYHEDLEAANKHIELICRLVRLLETESGIDYTLTEDELNRAIRTALKQRRLSDG